MNTSITIMHDCRSRLGLGTVQFGLDYGVSNTAGQTSESEVIRILDVAKKNGITTIDTAHLYGSSEDALGQSIALEYNASIITKTIPIKNNVITDDDRLVVRRGISRSFERLKRSEIYGLLVHHADNLIAPGGEKIFEDLLLYKAQNKIKKIGVSVYDQTQIETVLSRFNIDLIQLPLNVFDQKLVKSGVLKAIKAKGIEIHSRSAFLQGVTFLSPDKLPVHLLGLKPQLVNFITLCREHKMSLAAGALSYVMGIPEVDKVICGVNSAPQLKELCKTTQNLPILPLDLFDKVAVYDANLTNPALWKV